MGGISLRPRVRRYRLGDSVLANDRERTKPSCVNSPDWVAGPIQSRDRLKVLKTRLLAFGENRRVDPLEEFAMENFHASVHLRRWNDEAHRQFRACAGNDRHWNLL